MKPIRTGSKAAFTIIELLVVVAIIAALIALLVPWIGNSVRNARTAVGQGNLRQIMTGVTDYALEFGGHLPVGYRDDGEPATDTDWATIIYARMTEAGSLGSGNRVSGHTWATTNFTEDERKAAFFQDPNAGKRDQGKLHYSAHPQLMPDLSDGADLTRTYRLDRVKRPGSMLLIADGVQGDNGNAHPLLFNLSGIWSGNTPHYYTTSDSDNDDPIIEGTNVDGDANLGYIRFRQRNDEQANVLFVDGHVDLQAPEAIKHSNVRIDR